MARPAHPSATILGTAIREKRGEVSGKVLAKNLDISQGTLSGLERGRHPPSAATARAIAGWLGWTMEEVMDAAKPSRASKKGVPSPP